MKLIDPKLKIKTKQNNSKNFDIFQISWKKWRHESLIVWIIVELFVKSIWLEEELRKNFTYLQKNVIRNEQDSKGPSLKIHMQFPKVQAAKVGSGQSSAEPVRKNETMVWKL